MSSINPLREGMKILDPACGSGVFLVLIYARLIEMRLAQSESSTLPLPELLELLEYIYGIEREHDACYITEFSLILVLLHYTNVSEFLHDEHFKLPYLHNIHIFQLDFFDDSSPMWTKGMLFDWIIGNPPWITADKAHEPFVATWIDIHSKEQPIGNNSVPEAFSWRVLKLLAPTGHAGLILPAALLYNLEAKKYRQSFFEQCEVRRITNFSNLRRELFEGRATAPAITTIYRQAPAEQEKPPIEHYGPLAMNQITKSYGKLWTITINEHEYQTVSPYEAAHGDIATWKFALWGTHRDKRAIARLRKFFPQTLGQICKEQNNWHLHQGSDLRNGMAGHNENLEYLPYLVGKKRLDTIKLNNSGYLFSIPDYTYAQQLTNVLDGFFDSGRMRHRVTVERSSDLICCTVEFIRSSDHAFTPIVKEAACQDGHLFTKLQQGLKKDLSQWIYVQRELKIFGPSSVFFYKVPQLINWTRTQAMNDGDDMIAEILSMKR